MQSCKLFWTSRLAGGFRLYKKQFAGQATCRLRRATAAMQGRMERREWGRKKKRKPRKESIPHATNESCLQICKKQSKKAPGFLTLRVIVTGWCNTLLIEQRLYSPTIAVISTKFHSKRILLHRFQLYFYKIKENNHNYLK